MENFINFEPNSEEEKAFFETYSNLSISTSKIVRALPQEHRLNALKQANPNNTSLMALYLWALRNEDYETCQVAKELLIERELNIPK